MVEYGVKKIITNPTIITSAEEIIKVIDARSKKTKAFIVPVKYEALIEKLIKEIAFKKWAKEKKEALAKSENNQDVNDKELEKIGWEEIESYLHD
jgi:hypothetical protein